MTFTSTKSRDAGQAEELPLDELPPVSCRLDELPHDVIVHILVRATDRTALSFVCCSKGCYEATACEELWKQLCRTRWPHIAELSSAVEAAPLAVKLCAIPPHMLAIASTWAGSDSLPSAAADCQRWHALYRARLNARLSSAVASGVPEKSNQRPSEPAPPGGWAGLLSLYDESIALSQRRPHASCSDVLTGGSHPWTARLGPILVRINDAHHGRRPPEEGLAWLWLVGASLVSFGSELCSLADETRAQLDSWYDNLEGGSSAVVQRELLLDALNKRSMLEEVLSCLHGYCHVRVECFRRHVNDRVASGPTDADTSHMYPCSSFVDERGAAGVEEELRIVEQVATSTVRINELLLSLREEGCDLSVPCAFQSLYARRRPGGGGGHWWWWFEAPMHVSGGNPFIVPLPDHYNEMQAGRVPAHEGPAADLWLPVRGAQ